MFVAAASTEH